MSLVEVISLDGKYIIKSEDAQKWFSSFKVGNLFYIEVPMSSLDLIIRYNKGQTINKETLTHYQAEDLSKYTTFGVILDDESKKMKKVMKDIKNCYDSFKPHWYNKQSTIQDKNIRQTNFRNFVLDLTKGYEKCRDVISTWDNFKTAIQNKNISALIDITSKDVIMKLQSELVKFIKKKAN